MQPTSLAVTPTAPRASARDAPAAPAFTLAADTQSVRRAPDDLRITRLIRAGFQGNCIGADMSRVARAIIAVILLAAVWGVLASLRQPRPSEEPPHVVGAGASGTAVTPEAEREFERIASLGYIVGIEPPPAETGVLRSEDGETFDGLTLFTCGKGPEAFLINMDGDVVHRWSAPGSEYWARAHVFPSGDLLAITCFPPRLVKLDSNSNLIWRYEGHAHHDFEVQPDGTIVLLVRSVTRRDHINAGEDILDDGVVVLDRAGREFSRLSLLEAFERAEGFSQWLVDHPLPNSPDIFHTNSVQIVSLLGLTCALLSIRSIDTVAAIDMATGDVVWAVIGDWHAQHEAQLIDGRLLLFDNLGPGGGNGRPWRSRVLEMEADSGKVVWSFSEPGFFSHGAGAQQRLPNGNTLITESDGGRIIEVTPGGRVVWEYLNPRTVYEAGRDVTLAIMRAERLPLGFPREWIEGAGAR